MHFYIGFWYKIKNHENYKIDYNLVWKFSDLRYKLPYTLLTKGSLRLNKVLGLVLAYSFRNPSATTHNSEHMHCWRYRIKLIVLNWAYIIWRAPRSRFHACTVYWSMSSNVLLHNSISLQCMGSHIWAFQCNLWITLLPSNPRWRKYINQTDHDCPWEPDYMRMCYAN